MQLKEGQKIAGTLVFAKAGTVAVTFAVGAIAAKARRAHPPGTTCRA